ncbi:ABC transporter ATP-binding protein [Aeromicrobium panaciterrae]|uniref:ABC transporter ATP-binding protein n=1 Tax=Aeromicrobium panaciterrae TaxID=363861 RepID=UPI0031D3B2A6
MNDSSAARGAAIDLTGLRRQYGPVVAVDDVTLSIEPGEFVTLLGPSGSGKTTTLNLLAGFEKPDAGRIEVGGVDLSRTPAHERNLGVVFQNYALFPHLDVAANVGFGLRQRNIDRATRTRLVTQALETVDLAGMGHRRPSQLSGGQQQRVALARAIAYQPPVLLMDEPLGALDRKLRDQMQLELRRIHREVGSTVVFVTHDQEEALALSDRIAVFNRGHIEQVGTGIDLYERPETMFIATFLGESTIVRGTVEHDTRGTFLAVGSARLRVAGTLPAGSRAGVMVRPERLILSKDQPDDSREAIEIDVLEEVYLGSTRKFALRLPDGTEGLVREAVTTASAVRPGDRAWVSWRTTDGVLLPEGELAAPDEDESAP